MTETETIISGYCHKTDQARLVELVTCGSQLLEVDCNYPKCEFKERCSIGKQITEALTQA